MHSLTLSIRTILAPLLLAAAFTSAALAAEAPPLTWVDQDTGHRVWRLTPEPDSSALYFNFTAITPDGKSMVYNAPDGIHALDLATRKTRLLVPNNGDRMAARTIAVGRKTNSVFFLKDDPATKVTSIHSASFDTGAMRKLVDLPQGYHVDSINADETLAAGTFESDPKFDKSVLQGKKFGEPGGPLTEAAAKGQMMERRLASRMPLVLFAIDLKTAKVTEMLHSTDWINHLLFSPTDPNLLMYCHEGPWHKVDRVWTIRTDGSQKTLVHQRTMAMEIAGHEFWGEDGRTVWYDWQYPKGATFYVAGRQLDTGKRFAYQVERNDWSIHFNVNREGTLFTGDGGDSGQVAKAPDGGWIVLLRPTSVLAEGATNDKDYWQPGVMKSERLVNMANHDYRLEPNVRFTPDSKLVLFRSNMFGATYVLGVEVDKAEAGAKDVMSTPALARKFKPKAPTPTNVKPTA
ncbi:oligogalacturonide lyase [Pseudoduganella lurida]|uniref:Oligogalacturonide lyase n=1 Tax=Pseudoduganella lurida TaxID=1036180 RepID=A0A562RLW0_9BURK|nr:oligogalacturonate lyase family protein [Pseudoduganella lurida]TWI70012.1 oligogalacturonide lyase [Pseudoduganella lurida]